MAPVSDALLALAGLFAGGVGVVSWRHRPRSGAAPLAGMMGAVALWSVAHLLEHHASGTAAVGLQKLMHAGLAPVAFLWLAFVLSYTGRRRLLTRRGIAVLFAWPVAVAVLLWVPAGVASPLAIWSGFAAERGVVFWSHVLLSYGTLAAGSVLLVDHVGSGLGLVRRQGPAILAAVAAAWIGSVASVFELFGDAHVHAMPVGFVLAGGALLWAVAGPGLSGMAPVARRTVVRTLDAGVVVVDRDGRVTSANPAARRLLGVDDDRVLVGEFVDEAFAGRPAFRAEVRAFDGSPGTRSTTLHLGDAVVECKTSPVRGDRGGVVGGLRHHRPPPPARTAGTEKRAAGGVRERTLARPAEPAERRRGPRRTRA